MGTSFVLVFCFVIFMLAFLCPVSSFCHNLVLQAINLVTSLACLKTSVGSQLVKSKPDLATRPFTGPSWLSSWAAHSHTCQVGHSDHSALARIIHSLCLYVLPSFSSSPTQLHLSSWVWGVASLHKTMTIKLPAQAATHPLYSHSFLHISEAAAKYLSLSSDQ